jgi:hypothetical protein
MPVDHRPARAERPCACLFWHTNLTPNHDDVIPEGAGRCQGGPGLQVCGGSGFAGHGGMASRRVSPDRCPVWCGLAVGSRTWPRSGAAGVLDAPAGPHDHGRAGEAAGLRRGGICGCARPHLPLCGAGSPLAAVIPSCCPAWRAGSAWGGSRQSGRGSITSSSAPPSWRGTHIVATARPAGPAAGHAAGGCPAERTCPSRRA